MFQVLGDTHPLTKLGLMNFIRLIQETINKNQTDRLSEHPYTQGLLKQLLRE